MTSCYRCGTDVICPNCHKDDISEMCRKDMELRDTIHSEQSIEHMEQIRDAYD